jgi:hypothetical protein
MPVPLLADVKLLLETREQPINDIVIAAWERWWANPERLTLYRRTRATLIHNYMMNLARPVFADDADIYQVEKQETIFFVANQRLVFRFKKGDDIGLSRNIETQASLAFNDPQQTLPELPDVGRVDIAYVLNPLETLIDRVLVVARDGDRVVWSYPIFPRPADILPFPTPFPVRPIPPAPPGNVVQLPPAANRKEEKSE